VRKKAVRIGRGIKTPNNSHKTWYCINCCQSDAYVGS